MNRPYCWHCLDCLEPVVQPTHCERCPPLNDCDVEDCVAPGCVELRKKRQLKNDLERLVRDLIEAEDDLEKAKRVANKASGNRVGNAVWQHRAAERALELARKALRAALGVK